MWLVCDCLLSSVFCINVLITKNRSILAYLWPLSFSIFMNPQICMKPWPIKMHTCTINPQTEAPVSISFPRFSSWCLFRDRPVFINLVHMVTFLPHPTSITLRKEAFTCTFISVIRVYHVYKGTWTPCIDEEVTADLDKCNLFDRHDIVHCC